MIVKTLLVLFLTFPFLLSADDYVFPDGSKYEDIQVLKRMPDGIEFKHKKGISFKKYSELPESLKVKYNKESYEAYVKEKKEKRKIFREEFRKQKILSLKADIAETEKKIAVLDSKVDVCRAKSKMIRSNIEAQEDALKDADSAVKKEYRNNVQGRYWHMYWINADRGARKEALVERRKQKREYRNLSSRYDICSIRLKKCARELARERLKLLKLKEQLRKEEEVVSSN